MSILPNSRHVCCAIQQTCSLCRRADTSAVSSTRHVCCVTQQTCLLRRQEDVSALSHSRHVLLRQTASMSALSHSRRVCCATEQITSAASHSGHVCRAAQQIRLLSHSRHACSQLNLKKTNHFLFGLPKLAENHDSRLLITNVPQGSNTILDPAKLLQDYQRLLEKMKGVSPKRERTTEE